MSTATYRVLHREEPMIQGRACHVITAANLVDGKPSETEIIRFQGEGQLPSDRGDFDVTIAPSSPQTKA